MPNEGIYPDNELVVLLSKDDTRAFTLLYNRYWKILFSIAYNRLKDIQTAEDIVHDAFMSLWHNRHTLSPDALNPYLATAVKYMVFAQVRKKAHAREYEKEQGFAPVPDIHIEDSVHYRRILNIIEEELNSLPEKCRLIFKYSREQGMSSKEIAARFQISPKTVDNQINKALRRLKVKIKDLLWSLF
ncbi:MAG: RNA polymerase sigma-70 factor [Chitinophagaceae bacterium]|nr:RNA polymerase sigma-70 factor [Chitinophagaceae bacterium]